MTNIINSTITAVATSSFTAGVSIIRLSGENSLNIVSKIFKTLKNPENSTDKILSMKTHTVKYGNLYDNNGQLLDKVILLFMKAPNSLTGEDVVEIQCHGGILVVKNILKTLYELGAMPAEPGEFSKRAFLNGKMDLTEAESIIDLIYSKTEKEHKSAILGISGKLKEIVIDFRTTILSILANVEALIDYPDEDLIPIDKEEIVSKTNSIINDLTKLIKNSENGKLLKEGIKTVILGKPNVGKSSLLNAILDEDRAIVTDIAGTTRDIVTEFVNINGVPLKLIDTAGIRETSDDDDDNNNDTNNKDYNNKIDEIEQIGIDKAKKLSTNCDLILMVLDGSRKLSNDDFNIFKLTNNVPTIYLVNKLDLSEDIHINPREVIHILDNFADNVDNSSVFSISAKEKHGFDEVFSKIHDMFFGGEISDNEEIYSNERQKLAFVRARESLINVVSTIENDISEEFMTIDLKNAYEILGEVIGETASSDLISKIFADFCVGK